MSPAPITTPKQFNEQAREVMDLLYNLGRAIRDGVVHIPGDANVLYLRDLDEASQHVNYMRLDLVPVKDRR